MKVIVCIKQVPATNEVKMDPVTNTIIRDNIESIINPFDAYAIEEAIRIKEQRGATVYGLSMGIKATEELLKEAIALGIDHTLLLTDRKFAGADTLATSYTLSQGVKEIGAFDLIICGKMATDGDTAQVGPSLAKCLDIPYVTDVNRIIDIKEDCMICSKITDDGYEDLEIKLPALITVVKEINMPRLPSIKGMRRAEKSHVSTLSFEEVQGEEKYFGLKGSPTQVRKTFIPNHEIKSEEVTGRPEEQAQKLVNILMSKNILNK
ncbi:electron transfer flavoprotein subunit beta/FixA family protein [Clostridiaceae bacterium 35-E11]